APDGRRRDLLGGLPQHARRLAQLGPGLVPVQHLHQRKLHHAGGRHERGGRGRFGFASPIVWGFGTGGSYGTLFTDVTVGDNKEGASVLYTAAAGYDN